MSDWNRYPSDDFRRRPPLADDDGGYGGASSGPRGEREERSFEQAPRRHRGYRLGSYGGRSTFGGPPDYIEPGYGYGGETFAGGGTDRGYGDDRPRGGRGAYGQRAEGRTDSRFGGGAYGGPAFEGDNERLRRVADGESDHGHLFGGGTQHGHGEHRGHGPKGYSRSDERIHDDVADRLTADPWLDATDIEVAVKDGEITLSGGVQARDDKRRAESLAEDVLGVKHVQNNLRAKS